MYNINYCQVFVAETMQGAQICYAYFMIEAPLDNFNTEEVIVLTF